jgi:hypothetical protein
MSRGLSPLVGIGRRVDHLAPLLCVVLLAGCGGSARKPPAPARTTAAAAPAKTPAATASPAAHGVVLGQYGFVRGAVGWGDAHPVQIDVGGDPALVIHRIHWYGWGSAHARGIGSASAFNGHGGSWYPKPVRVELRAYQLGRCDQSGPRAYRNLRLRMPRKPGAPMGQWFILGGGAQGLCRP